MKNKYERIPQEETSSLIIDSIDNFSIAQEIGLESGDEIISINSQIPKDELDFIYYTSFDSFEMSIKKENGEIWDIDIEIDENENLGINLKDTLQTKKCNNHCLFCFIDQMPKGLRESLYIKDDDERLSFINGNYITLTNLSDSELERICKWKIPVNISVHTTDPVLRRKLLGNKNADKILDQLEKLYKNQVEMNTQIVLVPELNDKTLEKTIFDLKNFYPYLKSISIVPVGKTKYREGLYPLRIFTKKEAQELIIMIEELQETFLEELKNPFVFLSDEFYLLAEKEVPQEEFYGNFNQLENGVGMVRNFLSEFDNYLAVLKKNEKISKKVGLISGTLFESVLKEAIKDFNKLFPNIETEVIGIENDFFGKDITVTGLLTGQDIIKALNKKEYDDLKEIYLPESVLRNNTNILLDDITVDEIAEQTNKKIIVVGEGAQSLIRKIINE